MRMDRSRGEPASALLNRLSPNEIEKILWNYGDERWAKAIAHQIVDRRRLAPLKTTTDLVDAVLAAVPPGSAGQADSSGDTDLPGGPDRGEQGAGRFGGCD